MSPDYTKNLVKIAVPDIEGPTAQLCWKQCNPTEPPFKNAMARCDRRKGHKGPHSWELPNS